MCKLHHVNVGERCILSQHLLLYGTDNDCGIRPTISLTSSTRVRIARSIINGFFSTSAWRRSRR